MAIEYLTMEEARQHLGVSRTKMWQLVKDNGLAVYSDIDKRKRLVRKDDIEKLRQPQPRSGY